MSHFDIHTSAFYSFGCYPMQAPVIETLLHPPGERP